MTPTSPAAHRVPQGKNIDAALSTKGFLYSISVRHIYPVGAPGKRAAKELSNTISKSIGRLTSILSSGSMD